MARNDDDLRKIIVVGDAEATVAAAKQLGDDLARSLTTSQIRGIFGTVRRIEMSWPENASPEQARRARRDLVLLKPKMAYQAKRERGQGVQMLAGVLSDGIDLVEDDRTRFGYFVDFFEAILAYHKAAGGR